MNTGPKRRLLAVAIAGVVPWTVLFVGDDLTLLYPFGLVNTKPLGVVSIYDYFFRYTTVLPRFIESWGTGVLLYLFGLLSAVAGVVWHEDVRLTGFALTAAALSQIPLLIGFNRRLGTVAFPAGSGIMLAIVWWYYWPLLRRGPAAD